MLNGIHGHQDIERVVYGKPAGVALRAEAERLGAKRVFVTTTKSVAQSALLAVGDPRSRRSLRRHLCRHHRALAAALRHRGRRDGARRPRPT